jgi:PleD family two-component response regulator
LVNRRKTGQPADRLRSGELFVSRYVDQRAPGPAAEILIVDDEHDVAREVADGLTEEGYVCAVAGSAAEAVTIVAAAEGNLRVIVSDVRMPGAAARPWPNAWRPK